MTLEQKSIKSILAILDGADTDGSVIGDGLQAHSFLIAETLRSICKFNGAETGDALPFKSKIQIGYNSTDRLCEQVKHNAKEKTNGL